MVKNKTKQTNKQKHVNFGSRITIWNQRPSMWCFWKTEQESASRYLLLAQCPSLSGHGEASHCISNRTCLEFRNRITFPRSWDKALGSTNRKWVDILKKKKKTENVDIFQSCFAIKIALFYHSFCRTIILNERQRDVYLLNRCLCNFWFFHI